MTSLARASIYRQCYHWTSFSDRNREHPGKTRLSFGGLKRLSPSRDSGYQVRDNYEIPVVVYVHRPLQPIPNTLFKLLIR
jgi:hypothetical protein